MSQKKGKIKKLKEKELNAILDSNIEANIENPIKDEDVVEVINDKETLDYINEDYPPPITKYDDPQVSPFEIYVVYNHDNMGNYYLKTPSDLDENNPLRDPFRVVKVEGDQYLTQKSKDLLPAKLPPPPRSSDLLPPDQTCEAAHPEPQDKSITHDPEIARRCKIGSKVLIEDIYGDLSLPPEQRYTVKGVISYKDTENARQISRLNSDGKPNRDEDMVDLALSRIKWIPPPEPEPSAIEKAGQVAPSGETVAPVPAPVPPVVQGQPVQGVPVQGVPPVQPVATVVQGQPVVPVQPAPVVPPVAPVVQGVAVPPVVQGVAVPSVPAPVPPVVPPVPAVVPPVPAAAQAVQSGVIQATKGGKTKKKRKRTKKRKTTKKRKQTKKRKTTKKK